MTVTLLPAREPFWVTSAIYRVGQNNVKIRPKWKTLRKWGRNEAVGTARATIMDLPSGVTAETLPTSDTALSIVSSSGSDTQTVTVLEGHTSSGGDLTFASGSSGFSSAIGVTLTGQTPASLGVSGTRVTRLRLSAAAAGVIYVYETGTTVSAGVPQDNSKIYAIINAGEVQTQKCSTSISSSDYWVITSFTLGVLEKTAAYVQGRIEIKPWNGTQDWYPICQWLASNSGITSEVDFSTPLIVPANYDVRASAIANAAGIDTVAGITGELFEVYT